MIQSPLLAALKHQFSQTLAMLRSAIKAFPVDAWEQGDRPSTVPARLAYHGIETVDFYSSESAEGFTWGRLGSVWEAMEAKPPTVEQLIEYSARVGVKLDLWFDSCADSDLAEKDEFPWFPNRITHAVYSLRHLQQTVGELNQMLKTLGAPPAEWR